MTSNGVIGERTDGSLAPFTYLPDSNAGGSPKRALRMDFPLGASLVNVGGQQRFQFNKLVFGFGELSPLQFDPGALPQTAPLASDPLTFGGRGLVLALAAGQTAQVAACPSIRCDTGAEILVLPWQFSRIRLRTKSRPKNS